MIQISPNVFVETSLYGATLGVVNTGDGIVVIDTPQRPTQALTWGRELESLAPVKYIVCTEHHPDHITGVPFMPGLFITHEDTAEMLRIKDPAATRAMVARIDPEGVPLLEAYGQKAPDITFADNLTIHLGEQIIELFPLTGHTPGGIGVYIPGEKVVFASDIIFHKVKSFLHEADTEKWCQSLDTIAGLDADVIVPAHGHYICERSYLEEQKQIVQAWSELMIEAVRQGWSLETAKERVSNPDPYQVETGVRFTVKEVNDMSISRLYHVLKPAI